MHSSTYDFKSMGKQIYHLSLLSEKGSPFNLFACPSLITVANYYAVILESINVGLGFSSGSDGDGVGIWLLATFNVSFKVECDELSLVGAVEQGQCQHRARPQS